MIMNYIFPAIMERDALSGQYVAVFPDLPDLVCQGETQGDAFHDAELSLGIHLYDMQRARKDIPKASDPAGWSKKEGAEVIVLEADTLKVRQVIDKRRVSLKVMIPKWLKDLGEENKVNFAQILREGLIAELGISE